MSDTLRMDDLVSGLADNRVQFWHVRHAVSSSQIRPDTIQAHLARFAPSATNTLEALHNLARSGASSPPSRMSPAAPLPDRGYPG